MHSWHALLIFMFTKKKLSFCTNLIKISSDNVHITGESFEVVERLLGAQVAGAQDMLDLAWHQKLLEAWREGVTSVRDVKVA